MIIGEILCLLLLLKFHILLVPFSFSVLHGGVTRKLMNQVKRDAKYWIIHHENNKYLGIPNLLLSNQVSIE